MAHSDEDEMRRPAVTTGVASSYDLPDTRHDLTQEQDPSGFAPLEFDPSPIDLMLQENNVPPNLEARIAVLERRVVILMDVCKQLWDMHMDKTEKVSE